MAPKVNIIVIMFLTPKVNVIVIMFLAPKVNVIVIMFLAPKVNMLFTAINLTWQFPKSQIRIKRITLKSHHLAFNYCTECSLLFAQIRTRPGQTLMPYIIMYYNICTGVHNHEHEYFQ